MPIIKTPIKTLNQPSAKMEKFFDWGLGFAVAVTVFFQFYIPLPGGVININLADPFAIMSLILVSFKAIHFRRLPVWKVRDFNLALVIISLLLLFGFVRGWFYIGVTQWALGGRLIGWLVLLAYLSVGYVVVARKGNHGMHQFSVILICTAACVIIFNMSIRLLAHWGFDTGMALSPNFEGFASNRNAFAFQLLAIITLILGYSKAYARYQLTSVYLRYASLGTILFGVLLVGLFWTGSRAGIGVGLILLLSAWVSRFADRKLVEKAVITAVILWVSMWFAAIVPSLLDALINLVTALINALTEGTSIAGALKDASIHIKDIPVQSQLSNEGSNHERLATFTHAINLWKQSPLFGTGLGVFIAKSPSWFGHPQVVHNSALWVLAEFGLVGIGAFCWIFYKLCRYVWLTKVMLPSQRSLLMLLVVFIVFSLAHEIFYQRIFWLVLGALLAKPFANKANA